MQRLARLALSIALSLAASARAADLSPLHIEDAHLVDADHSPVTLRGVNLGNWLLIEPGGLGGAFGEFADQHALFTTLRDRFGEAERRRLIDVYRDSYITARDFDAAKRFGFNLVRVGFDYELFEDDARPMQLRPAAFKYLDFAVSEAKARGIYVWFDLHGAQERQVSGKQSGRNNYTRFWKDPSAQERSLWLWEQVASRYKDEPAVFGYEPLNEPFGAKPDELVDYCKRWYARVRKIDARKIVIFPNLLPDRIDFYGKPADAGWTNAMFDVHFYPGSFDRATTTRPITPAKNARFLLEQLPKWSAELRAMNATMAIGEMNVVHKSAGGGEMIRRYYDVCAREGWPITLWTLKELTPGGGVAERMWMLTTNAGAIPPIDYRTGTAAEIEAAFRGLATMPLVDDPDTLHWLTTSDSPRPLTPATRATTEAAPTGAQPDAVR